MIVMTAMCYDQKKKEEELNNLGMCCKQPLASGDLGMSLDFELIWELKRKLEAFECVRCLGLKLLLGYYCFGEFLIFIEFIEFFFFFVSTAICRNSIRVAWELAWQLKLWKKPLWCIVHNQIASVLAKS